MSPISKRHSFFSMPSLEELASRRIFLTQEDKNDFVINQGLKATLLWGGGFTTLHFLGNRYWGPYARQPRQLKLLLLVAVPTAVFFTVADRAAMWADRQQLRMASKNITILPPESPSSFRHWLVDNKYSVLGLTWLGVLGVSLAVNFRQKHITTAQRMMHSRMIAQVACIAGMGALAYLSTSESSAVKGTESSAVKGTGTL